MILAALTYCVTASISLIMSVSLPPSALETRTPAPVIARRMVIHSSGVKSFSPATFALLRRIVRRPPTHAHVSPAHRLIGRRKPILPAVRPADNGTAVPTRAPRSAAHQAADRVG